MLWNIMKYLKAVVLIIHTPAKLKLCNIYNNFAGHALDISVNDAVNDVEVIVDTFTVQDQFDYFAFYQHSITSTGIITIDLQNHYLERVNNDLYVSTTGDDNNTGLTLEVPIRTIALALQKIESDSLNPKTVYVASGFYSHDLNNQIFPLAGKKDVNIIGEDMSTTILNNDLNEYTFMMAHKGNNILKNFTLHSDEQCLFHSIYISKSDNLKIENVVVENSTIHNSGAVLFYRCFEVVLDNITIRNNISEGCSGLWFDGGNVKMNNCVLDNNDSIGPDTRSSNFYCHVNDYLEIENCIFSNTEILPGPYWDHPTVMIAAQQNCEPDIKLSNCLFINNSTDESYIAIITSSGQREINNCTFSGNTSSFATLRIHSEVDFRNNIMYNNNVDYEILTGNITATGLNSILNIEYCDITGGEDGIWPGNNPATINWLDGNIDEDPMFDSLGTYPFALLANSPCIDTGTPDTTGLYLPPWDLLHNYRVWDGDGNGVAIIDMGCYEFGADSVGVNYNELPISNYELRNYPNPFNPETKIVFNLPEEGTVKLEIYNIKGQKVKTFLNLQINKSSNQQIIWDGTDENNLPVGSGVYLYQLKVNGNSKAINKMILLK